MNVKVLKWNFVFQYGYVITNIINSIILLPLYLKRIDASTLGLWLATGNILAWMTLADPGVGDVLQQKIAQLRGKNEVINTGLTIGSGLMASLGILLISVMAGFVFYFLIGHIINKDVSAYDGLQTALLISIIATGMSLVSFSLSGINQGLHNSGPVAISSLTGNFLFLITNVLLLYLGFGIISIAFANLCRALYINVFNFSALKIALKKQQITIRFHTGHFKKFIKIFSFTSVSRIIGGVSASMDMIVLARFITPSMITVFEINKRPIQMTQSLIGRHSVALMPLISHAHGTGDEGGIKSLINTQFKYYVYGAMFIALCFCFNYHSLITAWTGQGKYAGDQVVFLLIANFFFGLIGYFMANMGYALGDIKMNSFINIIKGIVSGILFYVMTSSYGIIGLLAVMLTVSICIDFIFFTFRLYKLGYLNLNYLRNSLVLWAKIIPSATLAGWILSYFFNIIIPEQMYITRILLNGFSFTIFFAALVLLLDLTLRNEIGNVLSSTFKINLNKQASLNQH
ncbi:lipopolysaccharide biosynthesis protein [Pedobacter heparinus]|uniref:lipopolysaccharide biosynthesis protein n=1 Tax=Pedobacter heparinus TaxID=984 RepID=UPI00292D2F15|nr:lipopolysaccharide biosynthesis protein [Pedobacter heparinus]